MTRFPSLGRGGEPQEESVAVPGRWQFEILQVADVHYSNGLSTPCKDAFPSQLKGCSDLNTMAFVRRTIDAEKPDLIIFTGCEIVRDNILGFDVTDAAKSMDEAFSPTISAGVLWGAILGNHDQESTLSGEGVLKHIVGLKHTLSQFNPPSEIDGFEVHGSEESSLANISVLNLYFLDGGYYSTVPSIPGCNWTKPSQKLWFQKTSKKLQKAYTSGSAAQKAPAPGRVFFHIPLPEFASFDSSNLTREKQEPISSASVNSGGGFGYHAYGKAGWARRAKVIMASL